MLAWLSEPGRRSAILKAASMLAFDLQSLKAYKNIPKPESATDVVYDCGLHGLDAGCRVRDVWPLPNVWLGVSVENQKAADDRLDYLCELASQGWQTMVSFEPLLGAVDPGKWWLSLGARTWAICGGESGPGARPMHPDWVRGLRDQCVAAGVPFFFKQWGEWSPSQAPDGGTLAGYGEFGPATSPVGMRRVGKKAAGHLLDGVEWHQFPEVRA
jgi:hypothetical protein